MLPVMEATASLPVCFSGSASIRGRIISRLGFTVAAVMATEEMAVKAPEI